MTLRAVVFGAGGQLGQSLLKCAPPHMAAVGFSRAEADVSDRESVARVLNDARPHIVVNCAAYTHVDNAEREPQAAAATNTAGAEYVGNAARAVGARVIHVSTDYVFGGSAGAPYVPTDPTEPLGVYGRTKRDGERRFLAARPDGLVVRTAWLHGGQGHNFVQTAVRILRERGAMEVVDDQFGTPTRTAHLARALWLAAEQPTLCGIVHFTDAGVASWYDVAETVRETMVEVGVVAESARVVPVPTARVPRPAPRPRCSVLDKHASWQQLGWTPPHWRVGVSASTRELLARS